MKGKKHSAEQIIKKLREAETMIATGKTIGQVVQALEISEQTFHRWRNQSGGMKAEEAKRLKELEIENKAEEALGRSSTRQRDFERGPRGKLPSPTRRRATVERVRTCRAVSQRRACRLLGQPRSSQRYAPRPKFAEEERIVKRWHEPAAKYPRYGYRMTTAKLRQEGCCVNFKRIHRLRRREGLKVPQKSVKRRRLGHDGNSCIRRKAEHKDHVWTWDFIHDRTATGQPLNPNI